MISSADQERVISNIRHAGVLGCGSRVQIKRVC